MTALTVSRQTAKKMGNLLYLTMAAGAQGFLGGMAQINNAGAGVAASATAANKTVGVFTADAAAGEGVNVEKGVFAFGNSTSTDEITKADIGANCFVVDDQTVAKTNNSNARPVAGAIYDVDDYGVWVKFS